MNWLEDAIRNLYNVYPENCIIVSHADHDGFSSSVLLNSFFMKKYKRIARTLYPTKLNNYRKILSEVKSIKPHFLILVDSPLNQYKDILEDILNHTCVLNFDHHDILNIKHPNYHNFNPHIWGMDFLNSSGLIWKILREIEPLFFEERSWVGGIGAIQDYCIEDNYEMFKIIKGSGLIESLELKSMVDSKLMSLAKLIRASIARINPQYVYNSLLNACMINNFQILYNDDKLQKAYTDFQREFITASKYFKTRANIFVQNKIKLKFYDMKAFNITLISDLCEKEKEEAVYIAYKNGRLSLRALFIKYDVRPLARLFGGSGPNPRAAGAKTKDSYNVVIQKMLEYLKQTYLFK
ncbi:MAG: hypothetical protein QXY70_03045 [Nanopusillaceae archaeon]